MAGLKGWIDRPHQAEFRQWCTHRCRRLWLLAGPGGCGKSELLQRCFEQCRDASIPVVRLDHDTLMAVDRDAEAWLRRLDCSSAETFATVRKAPPGPERPAGLTGAVDEVWSWMAGRARAEAPELAMLRGLHHDTARGGVVLVDDWDRLEGETVTSRLVFHRGGPPVATPNPTLQPLADWLWGVTAFLFDHDVAVIVAGRRVPPPSGDSRIDAAMVAWPPPAPFAPDEVGRHLRLLVGGLPEAPAAALAKVVAATGGSPVLVSLFGGYVRAVLVPGMAAGLWEIIDEVVSGYLGDPEFGPVAAVAGAHAGRQDLRFWRLAIPRSLDRDMADALFPLAEGPPGGPALFDRYVELGLIGRRPHRREAFCLHDTVRDGLERFARHVGLWRSRQFDEVNRRLAALLRRRGADLEAARHTVLGLGGFEQRFGLDREAFWAELSRSALSTPEKAVVAAGLADQGADDFRTLRAFLAQSADSLRRPAGADTARFVELAAGRPRSLAEVVAAGLDLDAIVAANPTDWPVLRLVTGLAGLDPARRDAILARAFAAGCRDLDFLRDYGRAAPRPGADPGRLAEALAVWRECR